MPQPPAITALIEGAIRDRQVLSIRYRVVDGTERSYEVEPLAIRFNRAKHRVLWCWDRGDEHLMELIWDGIQGADATGDTFEPRPWVEPEDQ